MIFNDRSRPVAVLQGRPLCGNQFGNMLLHCVPRVVTKIAAKTKQKRISGASFCGRKKLRGLVVLAWWLFFSGAHAASFDCAKASTKVESIICNIPDISALDEDLAKSYKAALLDQSKAGEIKQTQKQWLKERNACVDAGCVREMYRIRTGQLSPASTEEIEETDIYESNEDGKVVKPLKPSSPQAQSLVSVYSSSIHASSFASVENLHTYVPLGDKQYLLSTIGEMSGENGLFLVDLHSNAVERLIWGPYEIADQPGFDKVKTWFLTKSNGGGQPGVGETALTAIIVLQQPHGKVLVNVDHIFSIPWDMEAGQCGRKLKSGKAGDINSYTTSQDHEQMFLNVVVTAQNCITKQVTQDNLRFIFSGKSFTPVP